MNKKRPTFEEFKEEAMREPAFVAEYEALQPEFELIIKSIKARKKQITFPDSF